MSQEMIHVNLQCHKVKHHSRKATEKSAALGNREKSTWRCLEITLDGL